MKIDRAYLRAIATVSGFIIGAGIFGVAFSWSKAGFILGMAELIFVAAILTLAHLIFGETLLRTAGTHRLLGLARIYLGKNGARIISVSNIFGAFGALLAYIIIGGTFLWELAGTVFPIGLFGFQILFFLGMGVLVATGLKFASKVELILTAFLFFTILFIVGWSIPYVQFDNFIIGDKRDFFLPFGVLIFALGGWAAVPEARDILAGHLNKLKGALIIGSLLSAVITALFASVILGISGAGTTEASIDGLRPVLGLGIVAAGALFGVLAIATSFIVLGIYLKDTFEYDLKLSKRASTAITLGVPFLVFLLGARSFINVISITGGVFGAIDVMMIMLIYRIARKKGKRKPEYALRIPEFILWIIILLFLLGAIGEIIQTLYF